MSEKDLFKYPKCYDNWIKVAIQMGYPSIREMLVDLYSIRTLEAVSNIVGFTMMSVSNMMRKLEIPTRKGVHECPETYYGSPEKEREKSCNQ